MNMIKNETEEKPKNKIRHHLSKLKPTKNALIGASVIIVVLVVVFGSAGLVRANYAGRVMPGVSFANIDLSGLDKLAATEMIQKAVDKMLDAGLTVSVNGTSQTVALRSDSVETSSSILNIDTDKAVEAALSVGHEAGPFGWLQSLVVAVVHNTPINPDVRTLDNELAKTEIRAAFPEVETPGVATDFKISQKNDEVSVAVVPGGTGKELDFDPALLTLATDSLDLSLKPLTINLVDTPPLVSEEQATMLEDGVKDVVGHAPYTLEYKDETRGLDKTWPVTASELMDWLVPSVDDQGTPKLSLDATQMADFLATVHATVDIAAQDARFQVDGSKVTEFAGSHNGVQVNDDKTVAAIVDYFTNKVQKTVLVVTDVTEPTVTTGTVNNLGITEVLGVGTSSFVNSPSNRLANIQHGVDKLNGLLIAPGETMSLVEKLKPFTIEDGYLPELVIKGDKITPEVAGGLCQIGTTTFRAVMNSGLKVVERHNHSLVVSYYNDPSNGNPGTDATIYDPAPDFKFMNDTPNYVLLATNMDRTKGMLTFTFWGTSDGRHGSYTPPQVLSWSGSGADVTTETDTLAPGVEKCQAAHPGATADFTYNVTYGDGTKFSQDFLSTYRSLPKICLVGKAADVAAAPTDPAATTADTVTTSDAPVTP